MLKKLLIIATLAAGLISTQASAAFVSTDWKVAGDKLAVLDEMTGLEWLNLTQTRGMSIDEARSLIEDGYFSGWRVPTNEEVESLFTNWFPTLNVFSETRISRTNLSTGEGQRYIAFNTLLGNGVRASGNYTIGFYFDENNIVRRAGVDVNDVGRLYTLNMPEVYSETSTASSYSVFLVSDGGVTLSSMNDPTLNINNPNAPINMADVSAPAGLAAAGVLMLMLGARRRAA